MGYVLQRALVLITLCLYIQPGAYDADTQHTNVCKYLFRLGDQIISVNGITLMTVQHADAVQALKDSGKNVILVCWSVCSYRIYHIAGNFGEVFNLVIWRIQ